MLNKRIGLAGSNISVISFIDNAAAGYGAELATMPYELVLITNNSTEMVPGVDFIDVAIALKDSIGQLVKGTATLPVPYILEAWVCRNSSCGIEKSLVPLKFLSFDSISGISKSLESEQTIRCVEGSPQVTAIFTLYQSESPSLALGVEFVCKKCGAMQVRVFGQEVNGFRTWTCVPCLAGQYIINSDLDTCQNCPVGTIQSLDSSSYPFCMPLLRALCAFDAQIELRRFDKLEASESCHSVFFRCLVL